MNFKQSLLISWPGIVAGSSKVAKKHYKDNIQSQVGVSFVKSGTKCSLYGVSVVPN
jgi:hypothetical protein